MAMKRQHDQHQYQHEQHQKHRQRLQHDLVAKQAKIEHLDRTVEQNQRALDNAFDSIVVEEHADRYAMFLYFCFCFEFFPRLTKGLLLTGIFRILLSTCCRSVLVELVETASVATASRMQQVQASLETMASRCERAQHRIDRVGAFCSLLPLCFTRYCCITVVLGCGHATSDPVFFCSSCTHVPLLLGPATATRRVPTAPTAHPSTRPVNACRGGVEGGPGVQCEKV
jgi:hypothetical protein